MIRPSHFLNKRNLWIHENSTMFLFKNEMPVVKDHVLAIPKREIERVEEMSTQEWLDLKELCFWYLKHLGVQEYNLGLNQGKKAGQSVAHLHFHIFPHFEDSPSLAKGGICRAFQDLSSYYDD